MSPEIIIRRYPRLAKTLMAIAEKTDPYWAASVIDAAKRNRTSFAHEVVKEAWELRRQYRSATIATRAVERVLLGEVPFHIPSIPPSILTSLF